MAGWRYDFRCRECSQLVYHDDELRVGFYCEPMANGEDPIHADNDYVVRCDRYEPKMVQICLFDGEEVDECENGLEKFERKLGRIRRK